MTDHSIQTIYQDLFLVSKEERKRFIAQSDLVGLGGAVNEEQVFVLAQYDAKRLIVGFHKEDIIFLTHLMNQNIKIDKWEVVACVLYMHYYLITPCAPILFKALVAHDEVFQMYCRCLYQCLSGIHSTEISI